MVGSIRSYYVENIYKMNPRFYKIAVATHNEKLKEASQKNEDLVDVLAEITEKGEGEPIISAFFKGYKDSDIFLSYILKYQENPKWLKSIMNIIWKKAYSCEDMGLYMGWIDRDLVNTAEALSQDAVYKVIKKYSGENLKNMMQTIELTAEKFERSDDLDVKVKEVAETFNQDTVYEITKKYSGKTLENMIIAIGNIAAFKDVNLVGNFIKLVDKYNKYDKIVESITQFIRDKIKGSGYDKEIIESINQDTVYEITKKYSGESLENIMKTIINIASKTKDADAVKKTIEIANKCNEKTFESVMKDMKYIVDKVYYKIR